jgi:copper homeostasis protein
MNQTTNPAVSRPKILEACVDSLESALAAVQGGANRLELCANLIIGGTTPSPALFRAVQEQVNVPIRVLIRPRFGDFLYTPAEHRIMVEEVSCFACHGASGVVVGALRPDGTLDTQQMEKLISAAGDCAVTLHRAFDVCSDPFRCMEEAISLGVSTILTSGQKENAWAGRDCIHALLNHTQGRAEILIGGGVNATVIQNFRRESPLATSFHLSGKQVLDSGMDYRNKEVSMGLPGISEFQVWRTQASAIRQAAQALWGEEA